jgi:predicted glycoside hydrolase/deacetylase ChbG (UPF0249 family)
MTRHLIVTADDYGMCDAVNEAIDDCLSAGALHATCVMVNMPACRSAATLRKRFPHASLGIHWTLTQGRPILPAAQIGSLVTEDGAFHSALELRHRWFTRRVKLDELAAELRAQHGRFCELAGAPDFWNTHQNSHVLPGLFGAFVAVGQALGIPAMRCHRRFDIRPNGSPESYNLRHPLYWLKGRVIARWSRQAEARGVLLPDGRIYTPGYGAGRARIEEIVDRVPWASVRRAVEIVIHPATRVDEGLFGTLTESRVLEYKMWKDRGLVKRLHDHGVEAVGFEILRNGSLRS